MNNARLWCVVKPTVGVPIFLGAVAIGSLAVHTAVLTNVDWFGKFFQGEPMAASAALPTSTNTAAVVFEQDGKGVENAVATIRLPDGRTAKVTFEVPAADTTTLASAAATLND